MESQIKLEPRRMAKGPSGRWIVTRKVETPEERRKREDRMALSNHLIGFKAPKLDLRDRK